jgi:hypothetical protein
MLDLLRDQKLSGILDNTKISKVLPETDIKKLMASIAQDVGGGSHSTISDSGKLGAYGFNLEALQTVGALKRMFQTFHRRQRKLGLESKQQIRSVSLVLIR